MNRIIDDNGNFSGGYFVINKNIQEASIPDNERFLLSCKSTRTLLASIKRMISEAKDYLKICSFIIDNLNVVDAIEEKLKEGLVSVFILTAVDDRNLKSDILDEDEYNEFSKSRHFEFIDKLVKSGAHLRASSNAHAKFLIKDGTSAIVTSANLTEPSLSNNEKGNYPNDESGIAFDDLEDIKVLERIFDSIFMYGTNFKRFINLSDNTQLISKQEIEIICTDFPIPNSRIIWSYERINNLIYKTLVSNIETANSTVALSTYSIVELNSLTDLMESIMRFLKERHGRMSIFCRAMNHRGDHLSACRQLAELGVNIYGDMYNHSKGISVDDKYGAIFTANIDGRHGLINGFEVGYVFNKNDELFIPFNSFLSYQIKSAPYEFSISPKKQEVYEFYKEWYSAKGKNKESAMPESIEIKYRTNAMYSKDFEDAITNYPIFYTVLRKSENKEVQIEMNGMSFLLDTLNENTFQLKKQLKQEEVINAEKYILFYKNVKLTGYEY